MDILGKTEGSGGEKDWKGENWEIPKNERRCKRCAGQVQGEGEIFLLLLFPFYAAAINTMLTVSIEIQILLRNGATGWSKENEIK